MKKAHAVTLILAQPTTEKRQRLLRIATTWLTTVLAILIALCSSKIAGAQNYDSLPVDPTFTAGDSGARRAAIGQGKDAVKNAIGNGSSNFGAQGDLYLKGYWVAKMTQAEESTMNRFGKLRASFLKEFLPRKLPVQTRRAVIQKILPLFQQIVESEKNFHPAVRVNAVTLIGLMYVDEAPKWPVPSPDAYAALRRIFTTDKTPDYLKAAAASSIYGFAECSRRGGSSAVIGQDIKAELTSIINGSAAGQDKWSDDLDYWLRRRAVQTLGMIGNGNDVAKLATQVMKSEKRDIVRDDFWLRFDGLNALKNLNFNSIDAGQAPVLIDDVLAFAAFALEREATWIQAEVDDLVYVNILWNDVDLEAGSRKRKRRNAGGGRTGGRGPSGPLGGPDIKGSDGRKGGGSSGGGIDDRGGGSGRGNSDEMMQSEHVELPVFMLNDSRARVKSVLLTARDFMGGNRRTAGISQITDEQQKTRIEEKIVPVIKQLLAETELGVIDYRALKGNLPDTKDVTYRLQGIYSDGAEKLRALMTNPPKEMAKAGDAKAADQ